MGKKSFGVNTKKVEALEKKEEKKASSKNSKGQSSRRC